MSRQARKGGGLAGPKFIFVTGGVVSSLGKGVTAAAVGALLQARGLKVRLRKCDPYLNVDPGTMNPFQHGEVYITEDGAETDLDLGHYERFTSMVARRSDSITAGRIYSQLLTRERRGDFLGATVQVIPHVTDAIKEAIVCDIGDAEVVVCEIGGTVGDIEGLPFLEAIRQMRYERRPGDTLFIHLTLLPWLESAGQLKTKPTQHSVKELLNAGIQPDILLCRSDREVDESLCSKISLFCNVPKQCVIAARDVKTIYQLPLDYHQQGLDEAVSSGLNLRKVKGASVERHLQRWRDIVHAIRHPEDRVQIAVIGKYTDMADSYKSLEEALIHGAMAHKLGVDIVWLDADLFAGGVPEPCRELEGVGGLISPGGFGDRGSEGKIAAARYAREHRIPYFGICFGMQMAVIEVARHLAGLRNANSAEFSDEGSQVVGLLSQWADKNGEQRRSAGQDKGGSMRLGAYECVLERNSRCYEIYGVDRIVERHRHRYEINTAYEEPLRRAGMSIAGRSPDGRLPEIVEIPSHPWFIGVQFHPEIRSRPGEPHPLFRSFMGAAASLLL